MSRLIILVLVILLAIAGAVSLTLSFFLLSSRTALDPPNPLAVTIAESGKTFLIPPDAQQQTNPVPSNPDTLNAARQVYTMRCAICHGSDGKADSPTGANMYPRAADLTAARTQSKSDGSLHWLIENGIVHTGMPGWKNVLAPEQIWQLVVYVRQLPNGIPPEPTAVPTTAPSSTTNADSVTVTINNYTFEPGEITVPVGTRVIWHNTDDDEHTVTSQGDPPLVLDSPSFVQNQDFEFTFTEAGTYQYTCKIHDYMEGTVVVQ